MLGLENVESSRACVLIAALDAREITISEFADAIQPLTSEALQVIATMLSLRQIATGDCNWRANSARTICSRWASSMRSRC
jgi:hypothetical protein